MIVRTPKSPPSPLTKQQKCTKKEKNDKQSFSLFLLISPQDAYFSPLRSKTYGFLINFLNYYCVIRQAEVTVSWSVRSR